MPDETKLLTPDDELVRDRLAKKYHRDLTLKEHQKKLRLLDLKGNDECEHPTVLFFPKILYWKCMKCNEKLIRLASFNDFRLFCEFSGRDPKSLMA